MNISTEVRDFLTSRRARITPEDAGLKVFGQRRVPGLRREEVAMLAGLSVDYYNRLERGNLGSASDSVLDALADALRSTKRSARTCSTSPRQPAHRAQRPPAPAQKVRPSVQWMLDSMTTSAALRRERPPRRARRQPARPRAVPRALPRGRQPGNWARYIFLERRSRRSTPTGTAPPGSPWHCYAPKRAAIHTTASSDLVGELATQSHEFRSLWAAHNVRLHTTGVKRFHHPVVGELELSYNRLEVLADGLTIVAYTAEPRSKSAEAFALLASWAATPDAGDVTRSRTEAGGR